jgi:hypothetical protein
MSIPSNWLKLLLRKILYNLICCIVAADPKHPPIDLAKGLVEEMVKNMAVVR